MWCYVSSTNFLLQNTFFYLLTKNIFPTFHALHFWPIFYYTLVFNATSQKKEVWDISLFKFDLITEKILKFFEKQKVSVLEAKNSAPIAMMKLDLSFGSRYQNLVLVVHLRKLAVLSVICGWEEQRTAKNQSLLAEETRKWIVIWLLV